MKIYLAAGEESGDLHGAFLARELARLAPDVELAGMAGARMRAAGVAAVVASEDHGVVGFVEVAAKLGQFRRDLAALKRAMGEEGAAALVAVDYGGFNARVVAAAKRLGLKTFYYIPPKLWAWGRRRGRRLARDLDLVLAIFPFEVDYWRDAGAEVTFVGHPLLDITRVASRDVRRELGVAADERIVLVLPGSRRQELAALWPPAAAAVEILTRRLPDVRVVVAPGPGITRALLERYAPLPPAATFVGEGGADLMAAADVAIAASGTATLELAILGTPAVILYKVNRFTWELGRRLVYVRHLGLPNIIAGRAVVPELLQGDVEPELIAAAAQMLLGDEGARRVVEESYAAVRRSLAAPGGEGGGGAPARAARAILEAMA